MANQKNTHEIIKQYVEEWGNRVPPNKDVDLQTRLGDRVWRAIYPAVVELVWVCSI